jgi:hypothetical protein
MFRCATDRHFVIHNTTYSFFQSCQTELCCKNKCKSMHRKCNQPWDRNFPLSPYHLILPCYSWYKNFFSLKCAHLRHELRNNKIKFTLYVSNTMTYLLKFSLHCSLTNKFHSFSQFLQVDARIVSHMTTSFHILSSSLLINYQTACCSLVCYWQTH